jgi:hypothetical protein
MILCKLGFVMMNVAEKWSLPYGILVNVKQFVGYMEKSV